MQRGQDEELIEQFNITKRRITKNRILLVSGFNIVMLFIFVFSMAYYQWVHLRFFVLKQNQSQSLDSNKKIPIRMWLNLLYVKIQHQENYMSFLQASLKICQKNDIECLAKFHAFTLIGYLCFSIFMLAVLLQFFDFFSLVWYIWQLQYQEKLIYEQRDKFKHLLIVLAYLVGLSLFAFGINNMQLLCQEYGLCFWICVVSLFIFISCMIYQQISLRKILQQSLIIKLIQEQKKVSTMMVNRNLKTTYQGEFSL